MKKALSLLFLLMPALLLTLLTSCRLNCVRGSGDKITETRKANNFTKIEVSGTFKINLKQDSSSILNITADDNFLKYIKTTVIGNKLRIETRKDFCGNAPVINIGVRNLEDLQASGAVDVKSDGIINVNDIHFDLSGATRLNLDLNAANVTTDGSGAAKIILTGRAASHKVDISGASKINAFDFVVGDYTISSSGVSKCEINVLHSLNVETSGASKIRYKGNPSSLNNDKSGAASIEKVN